MKQPASGAGMRSAIAFVPARAGSKRVVNKNLRLLGGHPLLAYTIEAARQSEVFTRVIVSTDTEEIAEVARHYGADVPWLRPAEMAADHSPDIDWVRHALSHFPECEAFSILRPTSPFRLPSTIRRAWEAFEGQPGADSLRAVERVKQHPGKMWVIRGDRLLPLLPFGPAEQPWHSSPTQSLPEVYVQNASLEIAWSRVPRELGTIAGETVVPFVTREWEGFDINDPEDFERAERAIATGEAPHCQIMTPTFENSR